MSYQEKRNLVNVISTVLVMLVYSSVMSQHYPQTDPYSREVFRFWGAFFLILIPVSIVARILMYIVFHILNYMVTREEDVPITDERDTLIELKGERASRYVFMLGAMLAIGVLVIEQPPAMMFGILIVAGVLSEIVNEVAQMYLYRRGL